MSRSRKKVGGWKDHYRYGKRFANKKVRRTKDIPNGKSYRKIYESWDISDWKYLIFSEKHALREMERGYRRCKEYVLLYGWKDYSSSIIPLYKYFRK